MRPVKLKCLFLMGIALQLSFLFTGITHAQSSPVDTAFLQSSVQHALAAYEEAVGVQTHLYNGTEYVDYKKPHFEGDQFFISKAVVRGNVFYDGAWYKQVPLLYDVVTDEVILPHNSSGLMLKLINGKVDTFQLHGHTFVHHKADSAGQNILQPGFYDLMYSQDTQFLVKRIKEMQDRATPDGMEGEFRMVDKFYIRKDGQFHQVNSKRSVYKVFKDKKRQLQKYASAQRFKFRKQREEAILALTRYYDSLSDEEAQSSGK
ncbi:hypothetical protein [Pontibacter pamirensis]|uniref:hypothetical protein n=1 Tax=Pontibacter pamirensis TaxID=2562824 RepID=UPI001389E553|nr:hypothetical protein [Pontibacter pamirensis]